MALTRVTQSMLSDRAVSSLQLGLGRLGRTQEQLSTGRILNRPSDSPTDAVSAMRIRSALADQQQYVRNGGDAQAWLDHADSTITGMLDSVRRARDLALAGANNGVANQQVREALAAEVDQLRESLVAGANTTYLGRPIFGGVTAGDTAYDAAGAFTGTVGAVNRVVGSGARLQVNVNGPDVFGPDGATLFDGLEQLSADLRSGNFAGISASLTTLDTASARMTTVLADVGTRAARVERAVRTAGDAVISMTSSLSEIENVDLPRAMVDLKLQEVAYQAALASTARVMQPSLLEFLR